MVYKKKAPRACLTKEDEESVIDLGKFYFLSGKYDAALEEFAKAQKFNPKNADIYYKLGITYEAKNEPGKAKEMYLKCLELNNNYTLAKEHLDKLVGE
jgi:tetratricopeptide (TPR) repeat protein